MTIEAEVDETVDKAIEENFLEGFFKIHRAEVIGMCLTEIDEEEARRIWHKDGFAEGKNEGRSEKVVEDARKLLADGKYTAEEISVLLQIPIEVFTETVKA